MWDLIVSVPDHCLSFYFVNFGQPICPLVAQMFYKNFTIHQYLC